MAKLTQAEAERIIISVFPMTMFSRIRPEEYETIANCLMNFAVGMVWGREYMFEKQIQQDMENKNRISELVAEIFQIAKGDGVNPNEKTPLNELCGTVKNKNSLRPVLFKALIPENQTSKVSQVHLTDYIFPGFFHSLVTDDNVNYALIELEDGRLQKHPVEYVMFTDRDKPMIPQNNGGWYGGYFKKLYIKRTKHEVQSGHDRQIWAELLISQLPSDHEGRNSWLLNFGLKQEAIDIRVKNNVKFNEDTNAAFDTGESI